jgi:hypothetical protein
VSWVPTILSKEAKLGLSIGGLAFKPTPSTLNEQALVRVIFGDEVVPCETQPHHDTRVSGNVSVESKDDAVFIYNSDIAEKILFAGEAVQPAIFSALGAPEVIVVFGHYDSSDAFGYAIVKNGITVRSRVYTIEEGTVDEGTPYAFEQSWLQAETFVEEDDGDELAYRNLETGAVSSEPYVTAFLLAEALKAFFGCIPWNDWNYQTKLSNYGRPPPAAVPQPAPTKAWWKLW